MTENPDKFFKVCIIHEDAKKNEKNVFYFEVEKLQKPVGYEDLFENLEIISWFEDWVGVGSKNLWRFEFGNWIVDKEEKNKVKYQNYPWKSQL